MAGKYDKDGEELEKKVEAFKKRVHSPEEEAKRQERWDRLEEIDSEAKAKKAQWDAMTPEERQAWAIENRVKPQAEADKIAREEGIARALQGRAQAVNAILEEENQSNNPPEAPEETPDTARARKQTEDVLLWGDGDDPTIVETTPGSSAPLKAGERLIKTGPNRYTILREGEEAETPEAAAARRAAEKEASFNSALDFIQSRDVVKTDTPRAKEMIEDVQLWEGTDDPTMVPENVAEKYRNFIKESDDPLAAQERLMSAHTISRILGVGLDDAYENLDLYIKEYTGANQTPSHFLTATADAYKAASLGTKISSLGYQLMMTADPKQQDAIMRRMESLEAQMPPPDVVARRLPTKALKSLAQFLPSQLESMKWGAFTGLGTAAVAAATASGATALTSGTAAPSIPISALAAFGVGMTVGTTERMREIETGGMYADLLKMQDPETGERIDPKLAATIATVYGGLASVVELFDISNLTDSIPGLKNIGKEALQSAITRAATDKAGVTLRHGVGMKVAKALAREAKGEFAKRLGAVASETLEEVIQEGLAIAGEGLAKSIMNNIKAENPDTYFPPATEREILSRLAQTAVDSALGMGVMHGAKGLGTTVLRGAVKTAEVVESAKYQKLEGPEQEVKTVQDLETLKAEAAAKLDEGLYIQPRAIAEGEEYILKIGTKEALTEKGEGKRVGYVRYSIGQEGDAITIEGFEKGTPANAQRALVDHLGRQFPGWQINWEPQGSRAQAIRNIIIENNPRGREGGLQYYTTPTSHIENITTEHIRKRIQEARPGWKKDEVDISVAFLDSLGKAMGTTGEGLAGRIFDSRIFGDEGASIAAQGGKAALKYYHTPGGAIKALVNLTAESNVSSWMHEATHAAVLAAQNVRDTDQGAQAFLDELEGILGVQNGDWLGESDAFTSEYKYARNHHEALTYALEDYFYTGKTARPEMQNLFKRIAQWLADLYRAITGARVKVSPELEAFFDRTFNSPDSPLYQYATKDAPKPAQNAPTRSAAADLAGVPNAEQRAAQVEENKKRLAEEEARKLEDAKRAAGPKENTTTAQDSATDDFDIFQGREDPEASLPRLVREERQAVRASTIEGKLFMGQDKKTAELKNLGDAALAEVRAQYEGTEQWMKAPNGKTTNLNETQWLQVRTPAFKEWFGDWENDPENASKVVDENGEPLVVYHYTNANFNVFNTPLGGVYFTAENRGHDAIFSSEEEGREISGYINARNIFDARPRKIKSENIDILRWAVGNAFSEDQIQEIRDGFGEEDWDPVEAYISGEIYEYAGRRKQDIINYEIHSKGYDAIISPDSQTAGSDDISYIAFSPNQIKSATDNAGTFLQDDPSILFQRAWHGTPHRFDAFTTDAIGTGEGAQAYGWGLYFAGDKEVAEWYARELSADLEVDGKPVFIKGKRVGTTGNNIIDDYLVAHFTDPVQALNEIIKDIEEIKEAGNGPEQYADMEAAADIMVSMIESGRIKAMTEGHLYETEIPDHDEYLDWDKPLDQQSEKVKAALKQIADLGEIYTNAAESMQRFEIGNSTGETLYRTLTRDLGDPERASRDLKAMGIPGIRYLDGNSRSSGRESYNYVVFADEDVEIVDTLYQGENEAAALREAWGKKGVTLDYYPSASGGRAVLSAIKTEKDKRGAGLATQAMNDIINHADKYGLTISLTPTSEWGSSKARLIDFYKRFGFVENKGKNKEYRITETMYRKPTTLFQGEEARSKYPAPIVDLQKRIYALAVEKNTLDKLARKQSEEINEAKRAAYGIDTRERELAEQERDPDLADHMKRNVEGWRKTLDADKAKAATLPSLEAALAITEERLAEIDRQGRARTMELESLEQRWENGDPLVDVETPKARPYQEGDQGTLFMGNQAQSNDRNQREKVEKMTRAELVEYVKSLEAIADEQREKLYTSYAAGIPNYLAYRADIEAYGKAYEIQGSLDADSLKWINDTVGHDAGDEMLRKIGMTMEYASKGLDIRFYHKSGDEYLIQAHDKETALRFYKRVDKTLEAAKIERVDQETAYKITVNGIGLSIGLAKQGDMDAADRQLAGHKKLREDSGKRAQRGRAPLRVDIRSIDGELLTRENIEQYALLKEQAAALKRQHGEIDQEFTPEAVEKDLADIDDDFPIANLDANMGALYQGRDIRAVAFTFPKELKAYSDIHSASQLGNVLNTFGRGVLDAATGEIRLGAIGSSHAGMTAGMKDPRRFYFGISRAKEAVYIVAKNGMDEDRLKKREFLMPALSQIFDQYKLQVAQGQKLSFHDTLYMGKVEESDFTPSALNRKRLELQYGFTETATAPIDFGPVGPVLRALGLPDGHLTMSQKKLATEKLEEGERDEKGYNGHGATVEETLAAQAGALDPEAVYLNPEKQNEFILNTGTPDKKGRPIMLYLSAPSEKDRKNGKTATIIKSFYGRDNHANYIKRLEPYKVYEKGPTPGAGHKRQASGGETLIERILTREAVVNGETENYLTDNYHPDQGTYLYMGMDQLRGDDDPSMAAIKAHARTCESWEQFAGDFENPLFDLPQAPDLPEAEKRRWYRETWEAANRAAESEGDIDGWLASLEENDHAKLDAFLRGIWEEVISGETYNFMPSDQEELETVTRKRDLADRVQSEIAESVKAGALRVGAKGKALSERYTQTILGTIRANPEAYARIYGEIFEIPELAQIATAKMEQKYANIEDPNLKTRRLSISQKTALVKAIQNEELGRKIMTGKIASDEVKEYIKYVRGEVKKGQERIKALEDEINDDRRVMTAHEKRWVEASKTLADLDHEIVKHHQRINAILKEGKGIPPALEAEEKRLAKYKETLERQRDRAASKIDEPAKYLAKLAKIEEGARIKALVQARQIEQRALKKAKEYQDSLVRAIMKKAGSTVNLEQARAIKAIQDTIDPKRRTASTQEKIDELRAELAANPELAKELPREWVNRAAKKNLGELTLSELEEAAQTVKNLRRQGRMVYDQKKAERDREVRTWQDDLIDTITHLPHAKKPGEAMDEGIVAKFMQKIQSADYAFTRPQQFIELLDGKTNGRLYELLVKERDRLYREELTGRNRRIDNLKAAFAEEGVKPETWHDTTVTLKGLGPSNTDITLTKSDMAALELAFRNEQSRAAALYGNFFSHIERQQMTDDELFLEGGRKFTVIRDAIDDTLTDADMRVVERIAADGDETGARLVDVVGRVENKAVETVDNYFPIKRLGVVGEAIDMQIAGDITSRLGGLKKPPRNGFTKSRIEINPRYQTAIRLDLYTTWIRSIKEQEHYIATAEYGKKLDAILTNNLMQEAVKAAAGDAGVKYLKDYVAEIKNPGELRNLQKWEESVRWLRGNLGVGYLAMKSSSVLKQLITSPWPALAYSGPHFFGNLFKALANPVGFLRQQEETSAILKARNMDPIMDAVKNAQAKTKAERGFKKINEIGMKGLELVDRYCVAIGWRAMYDKARAEGLDIPQAIEKADDLTIKTQPTSREIDLAPVYRDQSKPMAILLQFTSQLNVIWNNIRRDIPMALREHEYGRAVGIITGYIIAGVLMNLMTDGLGDDDEPEAKDVAGRIALYSSSQFIEAMPLIGSYVTEAVRPLLTDEKGYNFPDTALPGVDLFFEGITTIANNPDNWGKGLGQFSQGLGLMAGAPVSGIKEAARVASGDIGALFGRRKQK